jgi:hypothetical protein
MNLLKREEETNFKAQIAVLLDEKYKTQPKDDAFNEALEGAKMALDQLQTTARDKKEDAEKMVALLVAVSVSMSYPFSNCAIRFKIPD